MPPLPQHVEAASAVNNVLANARGGLTKVQQLQLMVEQLKHDSLLVRCAALQVGVGVDGCGVWTGVGCGKVWVYMCVGATKETIYWIGRHIPIDCMGRHKLINSMGRHNHQHSVPVTPTPSHRTCVNG